jgi:hypothetical protein
MNKRKINYDMINILIQNHYLIQIKTAKVNYKESDF